MLQQFFYVLPVLFLFCGVSGCHNEKVAESTPPSVPAKKELKAAPVFAQPASGFANQSSASVCDIEKDSGDVKKDEVAATAAQTDENNFPAGEDPHFAKEMGWPVKSPPLLPGSILPRKRIVAYYGNPLCKRMGALGEYEVKDMIQRLKAEAKRWSDADPSTPVQPALHLIAVVAQGTPGKAGKYRMIMPDEIVNKVYGWAKEAHCLLFIDIQTGHEDIRTLLPRFEWILKNPDVHLGIDPEFNLVASQKIPGSKVGTFDAAEINYVTGYLTDLVKKYRLPPKVLTIHRFTRNGVTNFRNIKLRPEVQIVMNMDGWGGPHLKRATYKDYIVSEPVQFTGFKLFYHNDTKKGDPLMTPKDVLRLNPKPVYIMYQ
ncbi:MAG: hypothetical protein WCA04_07635 [Geobacteraceae bacterium]